MDSDLSGVDMACCQFYIVLISRKVIIEELFDHWQ